MIYFLRCDSEEHLRYRACSCHGIHSRLVCYPTY